MHLRIIGVIITAIAILVLSATTALAAEEFTAKEYPATLKGKQTAAQEFSIGEDVITCSEASLSGELTKASPEVSVTPAYGTCKAKMDGFNFDVLVHVLGKFTFKIHSLFKWLVSFLEGKTVWTVEVLECTITVPSGQLLENLSGENVSGKLNVTAAITGIKQENTCGIGSANAEYKGHVEVSATNSKGEADAIEA